MAGCDSQLVDLRMLPPSEPCSGRSGNLSHSGYLVDQSAGYGACHAGPATQLVPRGAAFSSREPTRAIASRVAASRHEGTGGVAIAGSPSLSQRKRAVSLTRCLNMSRRSEEQTSELQSLMRISAADFCFP